MNTLVQQQREPELAPLMLRVVGFVDNNDEMDSVLSALSQNGFDRSQVIIFHGDHGLHAVERLRRQISGAEDEQELVRVSQSELEMGHIGFEVAVPNEFAARLVSDVAAPLHARHITYFGPWFTRQLT